MCCVSFFFQFPHNRRGMNIVQDIAKKITKADAKYAKYRRRLKKAAKRASNRHAKCARRLRAALIKLDGDVRTRGAMSELMSALGEEKKKNTVPSSAVSVSPQR